jgi:dTDP-4-dehydrorhamnose reductase
LIRTDQVAIDEAGAAVHIGETVLHFVDDAYITPTEARQLAEALVELADWAEGTR